MMQLTLAGNVGKDAELRQTQGGDSVLSYSQAIDGGKDKNGNKRDSTWFDCSIFGKRADALRSYITKGSKLVVTGRPTAREYQGKVYLGCIVNELTFMGGGNRDQGGVYSTQRETAPGNVDNGGTYNDMDDAIPF